MAEEQKTGLIPRGSLRTLIIAVLLGIVGIALMNFYFRSRTKKVQWQSVAVATRQIAGGDTIRNGWLVAKDLPKDVVHGYAPDPSIPAEPIQTGRQGSGGRGRGPARAPRAGSTPVPRGERGRHPSRPGARGK